MQSSTPLKPLTRAEANERLAELFVEYVQPTAELGFVTRQIQVLRNPDDIRHALMEIGRAMQLRERGLKFGFDVAGKKAALAHAGSETLEKFYFHKGDIDKVIDHSHDFQGIADQMLAQCVIQQAQILADVRAFRNICSLPDFKAAAVPVLECLFDKTGAQTPYIDPASLPPEDIGAPAGMD